MEYANLIYNTRCDLHTLKNTLQEIYEFLCASEHMLCEPNLPPNDSVKETVKEILYNIKKNRQQHQILTILKECINTLNTRIKYDTLYQHNTECGKIIIMQDNLLDCTLKGYLQNIYDEYVKRNMIGGV